MVTIAAVNVRNFCGVGARYVNALFGGCVRNLTVPFHFVCFTDDPTGLTKGIEPRCIPSDLIPEGLHPVFWKLVMFRPGAFTIGERVLYMDLDTIILSNLDDLAMYQGPFAMLRDPWGCSDMPGSGIMAWECAASDHEIWNRWAEAGFPAHASGDQGVISDAMGEVVRLQDAFPSRIRSFNIECWRRPPRALSRWERRWYAYKLRLFSVRYPQGASIVYFHGETKPHNCNVRWVQEAWRPYPSRSPL
jgi:hypothetical protein